MQLLVPVALIQQDLGICLERVLAPQLLGLSGPIDLDRLMTEKRDEGLILSQALLMSMREVPSYFDSFANNTIKGSILNVKKSTCLPMTGLLQFIVKQVPCRSELYLSHEPNVKFFLVRYKDIGNLLRLTVPIATPKQQLLSANLRQWKTEKLENNLHLSGES